jgi:hypothetical protein
MFVCAADEAKFSVFFPVSRELRSRRVRKRLRPPPASLAFSLSLGGVLLEKWILQPKTIRDRQPEAGAGFWES